LKPTNKAEQSAAEPRAGAEGNADQHSTRRAQNRESVSPALTRVRQAARQRKKEKFTALFHPLTVDLLDAAFADLDEDAAAGADDIIVGFERDDDARRFWDAMRERLGKFVLSLHPDKTRLIEFGRYAAANRARRGLGKPETFAFLGFTFICGKSRRGCFLLKRKSRRDRMRAKLKAVKQELRRRMHQPIPVQGK